MPPAKKRTSDADGKGQTKRRKKQKEDESDGSDIDGAGADFDNEADESSTADTAFVCVYFDSGYELLIDLFCW